MQKKYVLITLSAILSAGIGYTLAKKHNKNEEQEEQEKYTTWEETPKRKYIVLKSRDIMDKKCG